ncbi:MAG: hypothetical protein ACRDPM_11645 [Solirubrobacteraceae bacterium]
MCLPDLDSPSVFGALLDSQHGGRFELSRAVPLTSSHHYLERTNGLKTTFHTDRGQVRLRDALTIDKGQITPWRELVRGLEGLSGSVPMQWRCEPRFRYGQRPARHLNRWTHERDDARRFIERHLFSRDRNSCLLKAGGEQRDCGMLLAARRGLGERSQIAGTIAAIRSELHAEGSLLYRYSGMQDEENAFLACSFWMVEAMAFAGRVDEPAEMMDAVALGNDVGHYSEEMEPGTHAMHGNFPQALTHLALISAAHTLQHPTR